MWCFVARCGCGLKVSGVRIDERRKHIQTLGVSYSSTRVRGVYLDAETLKTRPSCGIAKPLKPSPSIPFYRNLKN
jgi:hypothetical protein